MKNEIFVDTSGWLCFADKAQPQYVLAKRLVEKHLAQGGVLVSTSDVFSELIPLLSSRMRATRPQILDFIVQLRAMPSLEIVHITPELHQRAFDLLLARTDKDWSWIDAASFVAMQQRGLTLALTTDHHFNQAGLEQLLP